MRIQVVKGSRGQGFEGGTWGVECGGFDHFLLSTFGSLSLEPSNPRTL